MDWCMMKKFKGYLVWALVIYTVFVTYFLVLSAWSDDVRVKKPGRDDKLINVLYQEERRHLRSFKDVIKTYGGMVGLTFREKINLDSNGSSGGDTSENGRTGRQYQNTDYYIKEKSLLRNAYFNLSKGTNFTGVPDTGSNGEFGGERPQFTVEVETWEEAMMGKSRSKENKIDESSHGNIGRKENSIPYTGNIFIEDIDPNTSLNVSGDKNDMIHNQTNSISNKLKTYKIDKHTGLVNQATIGADHSNKEFKTGVDSKGISGSNNGSNKNKDGGTVTEYCDKIDAVEPQLCLTERVTFSHPSHVNITTNHMSFKPIGDLYIYSGFLDTRRKPASIRFMAIAPKGRDSVKKSGYWCAFNLPAAASQRYYWNGMKEPVTVKPHQATQLDYYAASFGHDRKSQFYIMSCAVPERHLSTLAQFDTNRLHLVAGGVESPLLETVQERISVDVLNNKGLPWHEMIKHSAVLGEVFQINNSKNKIKTDLNAQQLPGLINNLNNNIDFQKHKNSTLNSSSRAASKSTISPPPYSNSIVSCIAPIITAAVSVVQIVEFIELTLLLGSQHIVLYTLHLSDDVKDVLAMYRHKGLVTVLPWTIPNPASIWAKGRDVALNDCLYRTMYRYEFALFHDMDEFFVPRNTPDLPSFINFLYLKAGMKRNRTSDIIFSSAYFSPPTKVQSQSLTSLPGYSKDVNKLFSLRSIHRTYFNTDHSLRMIRPVMAFRVGGGERKRTVFTISSRYAAVNHYSKCVSTVHNNSVASIPLKKEVKPSGVDCSATKVDMHMWRIKDRLIRQTKESIRELNSRNRG